MGEQVLVEFGSDQDLSTSIGLLLAGGTEHVEDRGFPMQAEMSRKLLISTST